MLISQGLGDPPFFLDGKQWRCLPESWTLIIVAQDPGMKVVGHKATRLHRLLTKLESAGGKKRLLTSSARDKFLLFGNEPQRVSCWGRRKVERLV